MEYKATAVKHSHTAPIRCMYVKSGIHGTLCHAPVSIFLIVHLPIYPSPGLSPFSQSTDQLVSKQTSSKMRSNINMFRQGDEFSEHAV